MSQSNGVIRIGRKGRCKFCIGDENDERKLPEFEIDVVDTFQQWLIIDDEMRPEADENGDRTIAAKDVPDYHAKARLFLKDIGAGDVTTAEAMEFIARLQEKFHELAANFRPRLSKEREPQGTSEPALQFSEEESLRSVKTEASS